MESRWMRPTDVPRKEPHEGIELVHARRYPPLPARIFSLQSLGTRGLHRIVWSVNWEICHAQGIHPVLKALLTRDLLQDPLRRN